MTIGKKTIFGGLILILLSTPVFAAEESYPLIDTLDIESDLRNVILKNKETANQYEDFLAEGCTRLARSGVINFIETKLAPIVKEKPKYCQFVKARGFTKDVAINMPLNENSSITVERNFKIDFEEIYLEESLSSVETETISTTDKFILKSLQNSRTKSISRPLLPEQQTKEELEEYELKYIDAYRGRDKPDPILKQTLLLRLWPEMSSLEQMKILRECSNNYNMRLNNHKAFWSFNDREKPENKPFFDRAMKICQIGKTSDLIPYIDESILSEYAYYLQGTDQGAKRFFELCNSWPLATFNNERPLPPTSRKAVLLNYAEFQLAAFFHSDGQAIDIFNDEFNLSISQQELAAIRSYTGSSYNPVNAYEQWGRLGLYLATRERQQKIKKNKRESYREPNYKDFDSLQEYKEAYNKYQLNLKIGDIPPHWDSMSFEEQKKYIRDTTLSYEESIEGHNIPEIAKNLKSALKKMDNYQGVSFGGHQLKTHLFTRLREGSTFRPGFFMSTSTDIGTAKGFLKITDADGDEEIEDKTGYLFVVKNETGTPIENQSKYRGEFEVLVGPDSQFKVLEIAPFEENGKVYPNVSIVYIQEIK